VGGVVLFCAAACWLDGPLAGVSVLRDVRQWFVEKKTEARGVTPQQAIRVAQLPYQQQSIAKTAVTDSTTAPVLPQPTPLAASGEKETKASLERLLCVPFVKIRPAWLRNTVHNTGRNLEIDCYNEELGVCVEYDGKQHESYPNAWHKTRAEFVAQQERDELKRRVCEARGLAFIVVPHTVPRKSIESFLRTELQQRCILPGSASCMGAVIRFGNVAGRHYPNHLAD